jgi:predicted nucleic acid-binding protein
MKPSAIALKRVVLVDTGPLVAAIDAGDTHHAWAKATLPKLTGRLFTCEAVASEAAHLLDNDPAAMTSLHVFLRRMEIVPVLRDELDEVFARLKRYAPRMDLADGCLVAMPTPLCSRLTRGTSQPTGFRSPRRRDYLRRNEPLKSHYTGVLTNAQGGAFRR